MAGPFDAIAKELFKRQVSFEKGRYELKVPFGSSERLNWIGSKHWAVLQNELVKQLGDDYFVYDYRAGKLWGHMFCSQVSKLVKTKHIVAEMMALISEQLGFGKISVLKLAYGEDWATLQFHDPPVARESVKLFGIQNNPIDFAVAGLIAGSAEEVLKRKLVTVETTCVGKGDNTCTFQTIGLEAFKNFITKKVNDKKAKTIYEKILKMEEETDFGVEASNLYKNLDKKALANEDNYLKGQPV